jgi:DNA-binding CsgD family transcriptional regulator
MKFPATGEFLSVRELAAMLASMRKIGVADRGLVTRLLRSAMERYPEYLGLWCVFEPNAFDGRDKEFADRKGHDATGRFAPRWHRNDRLLRLDCCYGHDSPALGGWYSFARESRQEIVFGPYDEQLLTGLPVLCLSRVAPILERDRFIGAVGVDISLDSLGPAISLNPATNPRLETLLERWHVFLKDNSEIEFASSHARWLLARHVGSCKQGRLPASLSELLAATEEAQSTLRFRSPRGGLQITVLRHPHTGRRILSLEQTSPTSPRRRTAGDNISAREEEVLEWLKLGKSNGEIAVILGISEHTVRHHLERIFGKLGVENRRAAMLCAQQSRRASATRLLSRIPLPVTAVR